MTLDRNMTILDSTSSANIIILRYETASVDSFQIFTAFSTQTAVLLVFLAGQHIVLMIRSLFCSCRDSLCNIISCRDRHEALLELDTFLD